MFDKPEKCDKASIHHAAVSFDTSSKATAFVSETFEVVDKVKRESDFCRAMLCISAAYAVMQCLSDGIGRAYA